MPFTFEGMPQNVLRDEYQRLRVMYVDRMQAWLKVLRSEKFWFIVEREGAWRTIRESETDPVCPISVGNGYWQSSSNLLYISKLRALDGIRADLDALENMLGRLKFELNSKPTIRWQKEGF